MFLTLFVGYDLPFSGPQARCTFVFSILEGAALIKHGAPGGWVSFMFQLREVSFQL